ncbi:MAG TPA: ABC transporter substrate-binding protein [Candidatus Binatia bacterium]|jgi:putative ABC transport system substrate-binding protein|nr:ABC transporter substrate-binding protein [Candidatus Binatia bacterium]
MSKKLFRLALGAMLLALSFPAEAQRPKRVPQIGYLGFVENPEFVLAFRKGLDELHYVEGQNIHIEYRYAGGAVERLAELAAELVSLKVDVIVASSTQATEAAKRATKTIPIVFPVTFDPVESGFVASLARPGGNLTGLSALNPEVMGKRVELLKEVVPRISRAAVLWNPTNSGSVFALKETETAANHLGIRLQILEVRSADELEGAFRAATREKAGALIQIPDNLFNLLRGRIADLARKNRMPAIYSTSGSVEAGGLMSYGASVADLYQRAATYVDKTLKGAKPADLPVEQPTKFEFIINLKTAKQIGVTIPPNVLARADKVIR